MGHQNHATGLRLPLTNRWNSKWSVNIKNKYAYKFLLHQDLLIKDFIKQYFISKYNLETGTCIIKRSKNNIFLFIPINFDLNLNKVNINKVELNNSLKKYISTFTENEVKVFLVPIKNILFEPQLLANYIAKEIEKRRNLFFIFQQILKRKLVDTYNGSTQLKNSILGIKVQCSGRLNGADRGRTTKMLWGSIPLSTLKSEILFGKQTAYTKYGTIGVKVWVYFKV